MEASKKFEDDDQCWIRSDRLATNKFAIARTKYAQQPMLAAKQRFKP
jgi:hypothetical protein